MARVPRDRILRSETVFKKKLACLIPLSCINYRQASDIRRILVGNKIVDHSDVVGASLVGAAPTTYSILTYTWLQLIAQRQLQNETKNICFGIWCVLYLRFEGKGRDVREIKWNTRY